MKRSTLSIILVGLALLAAGCTSKSADVAPRSHSGAGAAAGGAGTTLPACSAANLFLTDTTPIDASKLEVNTPKAFANVYPSGQETLVVEVTPKDSLTDKRYQADFGRIQVCTVEQVSGCDCVTQETGGWVEEMALPACMDGDLSVDVTA